MKKFSEKEKQQILLDYNSGMKLCELANKYGRNSCSIIGMLRGMGEFRSAKNRWTDQEIELLQNNYQSVSLEDLKRLFPHRKLHDLHTKAYTMGLTRDIYHWSDDDLNFLKKNYMTYSANELYEIFKGKYSIYAIRSKAQKLKFANHTNVWNSSEDNVIKKYYSYLSLEEIEKRLPNRTRNAIISRASDLGVVANYSLSHYFSDEQKNYIAENWNQKTDDEIAEILGKTKNGIRDQRSKMGLLRCNKDYSGYRYFDKIFRGQLHDWKEKSMKACNYSCVFTGSKDFAIHHIISFNVILHKAYEEMNFLGLLKSKNINDYSRQDIEKMIRVFLEIHDQYPVGVCVRKDIHDLFHKIYGSGHNNEMQWDIFVKKYREGVYRQ